MYIYEESALESEYGVSKQIKPLDSASASLLKWHSLLLRNLCGGLTYIHTYICLFLFAYHGKDNRTCPFF